MSWYTRFREDDSVVRYSRQPSNSNLTAVRSLVIDHLKKSFAEQDIGIAFFFCDYQDQEYQSSTAIIASLLKQLSSLRSPLPSAVVDLYKRSGRRQGRLQFEVLVNTLKGIAKEFSRTYIIIDALDECSDKNYRRSLLQILSELEMMSVKLFLTSRPHSEDIKRNLGTYPQIIVEASEADIRTYLDHKIDQDEGISDIIDDSLKTEIVDTIAKGAQGMYACQFPVVVNI